MPLTAPLNNNVLVQVLRDNDEVSRSGENESMKYGILVAYSVSPYHITASAGIQFDEAFIGGKQEELRMSIGKVVRWEEFAEGGQTFTEDGKTYALIPFWRLIGVKESDNE